MKKHFKVLFPGLALIPGIFFSLASASTAVDNYEELKIVNKEQVSNLGSIHNSDYKGGVVVTIVNANTEYIQDSLGRVL